MSNKEESSHKEENSAVEVIEISPQKEPLYTMGTWDDTQKKFMKQMMDRAKCYIWLYDNAFRLYKTLWLAYTIPVLVITTFSGVANLGQLGFADPNNPQAEQARIVYPIVLGILNIVAAILTALMQFFKIADQKELHRRATKDWLQFSTDMEILFYSQFKVEVRAKKFEKMLQRYKSLIEKSPVIPKYYLFRLGKKYDDQTNLILPETVGEIKPIVV